MKSSSYDWIPSGLAVLALASFLTFVFSAYRVYTLSQQPRPSPGSKVAEAVASGLLAAGGAVGLQPEVTVPAGANSLKAVLQAFVAGSERDKLQALIDSLESWALWSFVIFALSAIAAKVSAPIIRALAPSPA